MAGLVCLLLGCVIFIPEISAGPLVETTIMNANVFQTDIGEYAIFPSVQALNISCDVSRLPLDGTVELIRGTNFIQSNIVQAGGPSRFIFTYPLPADLPNRIRLTCRLQISTPASLTSGILNYVVEDTVGVTVWPATEESRCISSVGSSGTSRESATLTCIKRVSGRAEDRNFGWEGFDNQMRRRLQEDRVAVRTDVFLDPTSLGELVCADPTKNEELCRLPSLSVTSDPTLSIDPTNVFNSNSENMIFSCTSDPPAPIQWFIFGDYGNILDDSLDPIIVPDSALGISITSSGGTSRLRVTGRTLLFSNIHTAMCTTDGRGYFRVAVSRKEIAVTDKTTTLESELITSSRTTQKTDVDPDGGASVDTVYIILMVILAVIVLFLLAACIMLYMKSKRASTEGKPRTSGPYASYHPAPASSPTYMDINQPAIPPRVENDYTKTDHQGYEVPKT